MRLAVTFISEMDKVGRISQSRNKTVGDSPQSLTRTHIPMHAQPGMHKCAHMCTSHMYMLPCMQTRATHTNVGEGIQIKQGHGTVPPLDWRGATEGHK